MNQTLEQLRDEFEKKLIMASSARYLSCWWEAEDDLVMALIAEKYRCLSSLTEAIYEIRKREGQTKTATREA